MSTVAGSGNGLNSTSTSDGVEGRRARGEVPLVRGRGGARSGVDPVGPAHHVLDHDLAAAELDQRPTRTARRRGRRAPPAPGLAPAPPRATVSGSPSLGYGGDGPGGRSVRRVVHDHGLVGRPVLLGGAAGAVPGGRRARRRSTAVGIIRLRALVASACADASSPRRPVRVPWSDEQRDDEQGRDHDQGRPAPGHVARLRRRGLVPGRPVRLRGAPARRGPPHPDDGGQPEEDLDAEQDGVPGGRAVGQAGVAGVRHGEPLRPAVRRRALAAGLGTGLEPPARRRPLGQQDRCRADR